MDVKSVRLKRNRSSNYSDEECRRLVKICERYVSTIESKRTDAKTWQEKRNAWEQISTEFNCQSIDEHRTKDKLREKYEKLKKEARQRNAPNMQEFFKNGGGPIKESGVRLGDVYDKIKTMISLSTKGLPPGFDCDAVPSSCHQELVGHTVYIVEDEENSADADNVSWEDNELRVTQEQPTTKSTWDGKCTTGMSKRAKHPALRVARNSPDQLVNTEPSTSEQPTQGTVPPQEGISCQQSAPPNYRQETSARTFSFMADAKKELAIVQKQIMEKEYEDRREMNEQMHSIEMQIKLNNLRASSLEVKLNEKNNLERSLDITIKEKQIELLNLDLKIKEAQLRSFQQ